MIQVDWRWWLHPPSNKLLWWWCRHQPCHGKGRLQVWGHGAVMGGATLLAVLGGVICVLFAARIVLLQARTAAAFVAVKFSKVVKSTTLLAKAQLPTVLQYAVHLW